MEAQESGLTERLLPSNYTKVITNTDKLTYSYEDILKNELSRISSVFKGHTSGVLSLALNSDNTLLFSSSMDNSVRVWSMISRREVDKFEFPVSHGNCLLKIVISSDENYIALYDSEQKIYILNLALKKITTTIKLPPVDLKSIAISHDSNYLAAPFDEKVVKIWDLKTGKEVYKHEQHSTTPYFVCFTDKLLISCDGEGKLIAWNYEKQKEEFRLEKEGIQAYTVFGRITNSYKYLALSYGFPKFIIWNLELHTIHAYLELPFGLSSLSFSKNSLNLILSTSESCLVSFDLNQKKIAKVLHRYSESINDIVQTNDGELIISACSDKKVKIWQLNESQTYKVSDKYGDSAATFAIDKESETLVVGYTNQSIKVFALKNDQEILSHQWKDDINLSTIISHDQKYLISSSLKPELSFYSIESKNLEFTLSFTEKASIASLCLSADSKWLFCGDFANNVYVWDYGTKTLSYKLEHSIPGNSCLVASADGLKLYSGGENCIKVWDLTTRTFLTALDIDRGVNTFVLLSNNKTLISGENAGIIKFWDLENYSLTNSISQEENIVKSMALYKQEQYLVVAYETLKVYIVNVSEQKIEFELKTSSDVCSIKVLNDNNTLLVGDAEKITFWNLQLRSEEFVIPAHCSQILSLLAVEEKDILISVSRDKTIKEWSLSSKAQTSVYQNFCGNIKSVAISNDFIVIGSEESKVIVMSLNDKKEVRSFGYHCGTVASVDVRNNFFASGGTDCKVFVFDSNDYQPYCFEGHSDWIKCVKLSFDTSYVFSGSDDMSICVWNIAKKTLNYSLNGHSSSVMCLVQFPNRNLLASGSRDFTIRIWDLEQKKEVSCLKYHSQCVASLAVTDDETILYSGSEDLTINISDLVHKRSICSLYGHTASISKLELYKNILYSSGYSEEIKTWMTDEKREEYCFRWEGEYSNFITVSPNRKYLAAGCYQGSVKIFDLEQGKMLESLTPVGNKPIDKIQFTKNSKNLVIGAAGSAIVIWDFNRKIRQEILESQGDSRNLCFSPDYRYLISASKDNKVLFWDLKSKKIEFYLEGHTNQINSFVFTSCGRLLFSASDDGLTIKWDLENREKVAQYSEHYGPVWSIALASKKNILVSGGRDGAVVFWDVIKDEKIFSGNQHRDSVRSVVVSLDESYAVSGSEDKSILVWCLNDTDIQVKYTFDKLASGVLGLVFSVDGIHLYSSLSDESIISWNFEKKQKESYILSTSGVIYCIAISSDGTRAYTGSNLCTINVFDLSKKSEIACLGAHSDLVSSLFLSKDEKILVSGSFDYSIKVFNLSDYSEKVTFLEGGHTDNIRSVAITNDNKYIASGSDDKLIIIWNLNEKNKEFQLEGHISTVRSVRFISNTKHLISASQDETLILWDLESKTQIHTFTGHNVGVKCLEILNNENGFISGGYDFLIKVWNFCDRKEEYTLKGHNGIVNCLSLSSDDNWLISGSEDWIIKIWNLKIRTADLAITSIQTGIMSVALSSDGKYLLSSGYGRELRIWRMSTPALNKSIIGNTKTRNLSVVTPDKKFELLYTNGRLENIIGGEIDSIKLGVSDLFDPHYQNLPKFYNVIQTLKSGKYDNLHPDSSSIVFSRLSYTLLHVLCLGGDEDLLNSLLNEKAVLKTDYFGKSPLFYTFATQNQSCFELILDFLISLSKSKDWHRASLSLSAISKELPLIIKNSSKKLPLLLNACLVPTKRTFVRVNRELPIFRYNHKILPDMSDFIEEPLENAPITSVIIHKTPFRLPSLLGSKKNIEFLQRILECSNTEIYKSLLIKNIIQIQWNSLIGWVYVYSILMWINLVTLVFLFTQDHILEAWTFPVFLTVNFLLISWETVQMITNGFVKYIKDPWNLIDLLRFGLTMTWIILNILELNDGIFYRVIAWLVALLNFTRGLTAFRLFDGTRYYVRLILRAISDMGYFLILLSYSTITFGVMFQVSRNNGPFEFKSLWMDSYSLNFGNFEPQENYQFSFETIAYILATVVNVVLMLNLLISILGDSFSNFQNDKVFIDYSEKVEVLLEIQNLFFWVGLKEKNEYFQIMSSNLIPQGEADAGEIICELERKVEYANNQLSNKIESAKADLGDNIKEINRKVESLEEKLNGLTENVMKIIELVTPKDGKIGE